MYEAEHHAIAGRRAAVKVMDAQSVLQPDQNRSFVNEASAASRIAHEHIVQVFDGGVTEAGVCYVVMELLSGQSLAQVLLRGRWNVGRTVDLGLQAASALQAAHNIGIFHSKDYKKTRVVSGSVSDTRSDGETAHEDAQRPHPRIQLSLGVKR